MTLNWNPDEYITAYNFAAQAHLGQTMPGSDISYLLHISLVTMEVIGALHVEIHHNGSLAVQCALLHDVIEDTNVTYDEVARTFGTQVADGVLALSKNPDIEKSQQMADSLQRIQIQPPEIAMVKLADRITNLRRPPATWTKGQISRYPRESQLIYDMLHPASDYLAQRLLKKMDEYQQWIN
ncbi:bifunctional (p)ppGpp synthetase/guanosine-3',5'-bis(diphosphate) 3'-pyrophosphohydrolase [candidate division KSB1 bacterium]|nr:bifunctional (p)ppGpp synthetase/guanosine-3',5'-bis(diphosphate) 3'-pyrophosphohydrolase [candidate division KSB1 bacterium]